MRDILRKAKPQRLEDLIALNALYRPGPLRSGMVDDFIARKQGKTEVKYELPALEPILAETYGVIAYQEQVMRIANVLAGFTLGEADVLRKAMGKKKAEVMAKMREKFVDGREEQGHRREEGGRSIFDLMEHFAGYGFNKSHSTAYALLAYQTAYLKANYPWHFAAALLTIEVAEHRQARAVPRGVPRTRHPGPAAGHQRKSARGSPSIQAQGVRFGLTAIKNVGEGAIESLLDVRTKQGRITSLQALCEDLDLRLVNKRVFESLVKAGAFDSLARGQPAYASLPTLALRPRLLAAIDAACEHGARLQRDQNEGQAQLFGAFGDEAGDRRGRAREAVPLPDAPAWSETEQLDFEKETLGLYWSGHPVDRYAAELKAVWCAHHRRAGGSAGERRARRRVGSRRSQADRARHEHRRYHRGLPAAEDTQGRPHGGLHARGCAGRCRGDCVSGGVPACGIAHRKRDARAGSRQARARRRVGADPGV